MVALAIQQQQGNMRVQEITAGLCMEFVSWIDRSEKTARTYIVNLRQFMAWLHYTGTRNPQRADIISYRDWLAAEHEAIQFDNLAGWKYRTDRAGEIVRVQCKPNTVAQYLRSVCQFFKWTAASGFYPDVAANVHAPKVSRSTHRKEALSPAEVLDIEHSIAQRASEASRAAEAASKDKEGRTQRADEQGKRLYAMYLLAVNAGLRTVEISRANIKDIVTKGGQAWLYVWGKGRTEPDQKKPLAQEVLEAINDYLAARVDSPTGNSPLFVSTGNRSGGKRLATTTISTMLKKAMVEAGYNSDRLTAHSLRHTAGTAVQGLCGDIYTTQKYMRHSNPATTEIYLHNDTSQKEAELAQQLYNLYHGTKTDRGQQLQGLLNRMNPAQLEQLTAIAAAMV